MKKIKLLLQIFVICLILFMSINLAGEIYALCTPKFDIKSANSFYMYDNKLELVFYGKGEDKWIDLEDMNNNVINSTLAVEDKNFYKHNGFNFFRIAKAMFENLKSGEIVQGASTITQQYAKNLEAQNLTIQTDLSQFKLLPNTKRQLEAFMDASAMGRDYKVPELERNNLNTQSVVQNRQQERGLQF